MRHGGEILANALAAHGVGRVFSVPGESFLAALDGLYEIGIPNTVCRQEGGAAMMAEAWGKLTGQPGVLFVTRGPGVSNACAGLHVAMQDSTPMIAFVGQISRGHRDREAFQEVDYRSVFGSFVKWVAEVDQTERLPEYINRAFHMAMSGRPGPVVLALPEDMLSALSDAPDLAPTAPAIAGVSDAQVSALAGMIAAAERPLIVAGGPGWSEQAAADLKDFAESWGLPVAVTFRRQGHMDNRSPAYAGDLAVGMNPQLGARLQSADLLVLLGTRFGDIPTGGYELIDPAAPGVAIAHIHPSPDEIGRVYRTDLAIPARAADVLAALVRLTPPPRDLEWQATARAEYETWQQPKETPGAVKLEQVIGWLSANLPDDAVLTNGAGNYAAFLHRYFRFKHYGTQLAPTSGSMGYGFPAAIAASLASPGSCVVCLAGDGCFQMTLNEMSTAVQHGATPIVVVVNNGRYGTIRMHQENHYPGRVSGTDLVNPDFAALARAYGGHGETVVATADFPVAFARARDSGKPAVIELQVDPDTLSTGQSLSGTRAAALARLGR
ncbi:thiamine pyrophosphate-binding protein [Oceaniovalibus sp. ACAM 378]|uniref:thiamine pyrophosphate-binding protein n=1 Tax=Oceaniovalibus sp. ACAM 378 TaxID=2599923 RepID=UPI0011D3CE8E|nr:thiamine pyrophosphate-binding protein [Oceaniovalibus sp. ACAM 378]TYB86374.1 thiamine pyrophosphate-binding protein [Oceaniovalibus sp. ACAM 378]